MGLNDMEQSSGKGSSGPVIPFLFAFILLVLSVVLIFFETRRPDGNVKEMTQYDADDKLMSTVEYDTQGSPVERTVYDGDEEVKWTVTCSYSYNDDDEITDMSYEMEAEDYEAEFEAAYDEDGILDRYTVTIKGKEDDTREEISYDGSHNELRHEYYQGDLMTQMEDSAYDSAGALTKRAVYVSDGMGGMKLAGLLDFSYETKGSTMRVIAEDFFAEEKEDTEDEDKDDGDDDEDDEDEEETDGKSYVMTEIKTDDLDHRVSDRTMDSEGELTSYKEYVYYE